MTVEPAAPTRMAEPAAAETRRRVPIVEDERKFRERSNL
jgi:hypothetical protein